MTRTSVEKPAGSGALILGLLLAALLAVSLTLTVEPAHAGITFTVNTTQDPGDGTCGAGAGGCTLREAINAANANPGADRINFNIPDTVDPGVKTISPISGLPLVTGAVTIDGYSQPGATENTQPVGTGAKLLIELDGTNSRSTGLIIRASGAEVRGLVINDFVFGGISINNGGSNAKIEGNFIGTDPSGNGDQGNGGQGVSILFGSSKNNIVGGASRAERNLISGNGASGVEIQQSSSNSVLGNLIGTKKDGKSALGNTRQGVLVLDSSDNTVGGDVSGTANTIAFNGGDGVEVRGATSSFVTLSNGIFNNSIFSNGEEGIDLGGDGPTANDPGDADNGPNGLQNKPAISSAKTGSAGTTIRGNLDGVPGGAYAVRFYSNPGGNDEGKKLIGAKSVTTGSDGKASFTFLPANKVAVGQAITATATDAEDNTSEFSAPKSVAR